MKTPKNFGTIISINETTNVPIKGPRISGDGYEIKTSKHTIKLLIYNHQCCCENWGYFMSEDNLTDFIGTKLLNVQVVDTILKTEQVVNLYEGNAMFVNLETSKGVLQFVAYNEHNGYYGHDAWIIIDDDIKHKEGL